MFTVSKIKQDNELLDNVNAEIIELSDLAKDILQKQIDDRHNEAEPQREA